MLKKSVAFLMVLCMLIGVPAFADSSSKTGEYQGTIVEITNKQITVKTNLTQSTYETMVFNLSRNTAFENCHLTELNKGDVIYVTHALAITKSAVPQAAALKVRFAKETATTFNYEGSVKEINKVGEYTMVLVETKDAKEANKQIHFVVSKDTKITSGNLADIKVGSKLRLTYGPIMTMSIPPQTVALSIDIVKDDQPNHDSKFVESEGRITKIEKSGDDLIVTVLIKKEKSKPTIMKFLVNDETEFDDGDIEDLRLGKKIEIEYFMGSNVNTAEPVQAISVEID